jgi:sensor domain CHASE-containing protein
VNLIEKEIAKQANAIRTKIGENVVTNFQSLEDLSNPLES